LKKKKEKIQQEWAGFSPGGPSPGRIAPAARSRWQLCKKGLGVLVNRKQVLLLFLCVADGLQKAPQSSISSQGKVLDNGARCGAPASTKTGQTEQGLVPSFGRNRIHALTIDSPKLIAQMATQMSLATDAAEVINRTVRSQ
jgi:hypothetical protein